VLPLNYTGRYFDEATGLQYNHHRWYDPKIGRWLSEDPIGFAGDPSNLYRYVGNGPTNVVDPSGLDAPGDLIKCIINATNEINYIGEEDSVRNPDFWEERQQVDKQGKPIFNKDGTPATAWFLKPPFTKERMIEALKDLTKSKDANDPKRNEMYCKRASSIAVLKGFMDYFSTQKYEKGIKWLLNLIATSKGDVEVVMDTLTVRIDEKEKNQGIPQADIKPGDQVHIKNGIYDKELDGNGDQGKNVVAVDNGQNYIFPNGGGAFFSYGELQEQIMQWNRNPPREKINIDFIRRPILPTQNR
jgi:RHS repeat-associated protein